MASIKVRLHPSLSETNQYVRVGSQRAGRRASQDVFLALFLMSITLCLLLFANAMLRLSPDSRHELFETNAVITKRQPKELNDHKFNPCASHHDADLVMITSITRPFRDHANARNWKHTLWQQFTEIGSYKKPLLWVFTENNWEISHLRQPLSASDFPFADCVLDVFDVLPKALRDVSSVDAFYEIPGTPGLNTRIKDGKVLMRKVAAIAHTLGVMKDDALVLWVDVDVVPLRPLDDQFLNFVRSRDVSYLPETICWRDLQAEAGYTSIPDHCLDFRVDTGIVAFKVSKKTRTFSEWWIGSYSSSPGRMLALARTCFENATLDEEEDRETVAFFARKHSKIRSKVRSAKELCSFNHIRSNIGMNDIYTFALALHSFGSEIDHGWIAYKSTSCDIHEQKVKPGGHCHPCVATSDSTNKAATSLISPFVGRHYLHHVKGGTAIMARQHTYRKEMASVHTQDAELLLPAKYFPITSHIDHRLACGDKRAAYGLIWSLKQVQSSTMSNKYL